MAVWRSPVSVVDAITLAALVTVGLVIVVPRIRVRGLLDNEDAVIAVLEDLERLEEAHRASAATDADKDGRGEYAALSDVLSPESPGFERIEGTDIWRREGYYYTVLLPDRDKRAIAATSLAVHADHAEVAELLVAWPIDPGHTGMRAYCRWPGGILLQHAVDGYPYARDPPVPNAFLVARDAGGPRAADRYSGEDWRSPVFSTSKRTER